MKTMPEKTKSFFGMYFFPLTTKHTRWWDNVKYLEGRPLDYSHAIGRMINGTKMESGKKQYFAYVGERAGSKMKLIFPAL